LGSSIALFSLWVSFATAKIWLWSLPLSIAIFVVTFFFPKKLNLLLMGIDYLHQKLRLFVAAISFFAVITPMAWFLRLFRQNVIPLKLLPHCKTYWQNPTEEKRLSAIDFNKQF
jgi:hypothetical protein